MLFGKRKLPQELQGDSRTNQALDVAGLVRRSTVSALSRRSPQAVLKQN